MQNLLFRPFEISADMESPFNFARAVVWSALVGQTPAALQFNLGHNDVRRREEDSDGGDYGKESERYETEAVEHHCSKLPVILDGSCVLVITYLKWGLDDFNLPGPIQLSNLIYLVRDHPDLLKDEAELAVDTGREIARRRRRG